MNDNEVVLIDLVITNSNGVSLTEVIRVSGLSKTTAYRNLENLTKINLFYKSGGKYYPGAVLIRWMNVKKTRMSVTRIFEPYLRDLLERFNHTVHLVQLQDNFKAVYIEKLQHEGVLQIKSNLGDELKLYSTGAGRAILAELSDGEIKDYFNSIGDLVAFTAHTVTDKERLFALIQDYRKQGFSTEIEQNEKGVTCVGVAFRHGDLILAISIVLTFMNSEERLREIGEYLVSVKKQILHDLY